MARVGRPLKGDEITKEQYAEALQKCKGRRYLAAKMLGVSSTAVSKACARYPELQEIREEYKIIRVEAAQSIIDWNMSNENPDQDRKLRAAMFTLNTESDEHATRNKTELSVPVAPPDAGEAFSAMVAMIKGGGDVVAE